MTLWRKQEEIVFENTSCAERRRLHVDPPHPTRTMSRERQAAASNGRSGGWNPPVMHAAAGCEKNRPSADVAGELTLRAEVAWKLLL